MLAAVVLWLAWALVPAFLFWGAIWESATLFGEQPTADEMASAHQQAVTGALVALVVPLAGLLLMRRVRSRVGAWCYGVAAVLGAGALVLVLPR